MKKISVNIPDDVSERIDVLVKATGVQKSDLIVNMLDEYSKTLIATKKVGILNIAILFRDLGEKMKGWAEEIKEKKKFKGIEVE